MTARGTSRTRRLAPDPRREVPLARYSLTDRTLRALGGHGWRTCGDLADAGTPALLSLKLPQPQFDIARWLAEAVRGWEMPLGSRRHRAWQAGPGPLEPEPGTVRHGLYLTGLELRAVLAAIDGRPVAAAVLASARQVIADAAAAEPACTIDPALEAVMEGVAWTECPGGYEMRVPADLAALAFRPVWRRWDATFLGTDVAIICDGHPIQSFQAYAGIDGERSRFLGEAARLSVAKAIAVQRLLSSVPTTSPMPVHADHPGFCSFGSPPPPFAGSR